MSDTLANSGTNSSERGTAAATAPARRRRPQADPAADRMVAFVDAYFDEMLAAGEVDKARSVTRRMTICALLLEQTDPRDGDDSLGRIASALRRQAKRTPAAISKTASEARAFLRYGVTPAKGLGIPDGTDEGLRRSIAAYDWALMSVSQREVLNRRAQDLSGRRGGRPYKRVFRVLAAVAQLQANAAQGDAMADAELRLLRSMVEA